MPPAIENGLPAPPVPQKLRELLKDYPELIERLQQQLNFAVLRPSKVTPPFEWAIWMLEDELDSFISEAREELERVQASGDANAVKMAEEKERLTRHARSRNRGMSDLDQLWNYIETHRVPMPERKDPAMSKPMPPAIENGLPAPPVPQKLRELLKDYPELIQRLQEVLDDYSRKPNRLMPFDGAIWALEGRLDSFFSEAREELEAAYAKGDPEGIEKAKKKRFAVGYSRLNKGPMSELASYFEGARDQVIRNARP
ncbi:UNVERIFIED_CONTAM: hypothetical protein EX528_10015 [Xanthomonas axonopodis]